MGERDEAIETIRVYFVGAEDLAYHMHRLRVGLPEASRKGNLRMARSVMMKARHLVDTRTVAHTGTLRSDIRIKPRGRNYDIVVGEYAPYAYIIEKGRKAIRGYKFIPTQQFPLEGYAVPEAGRVIRPAKGTHFMRDAIKHTKNKFKHMVKETGKLIKKR